MMFKSPTLLSTTLGVVLLLSIATPSMSSCTQCQAGKYFHDGDFGNSCKDCPAGETSDATCTNDNWLGDDTTVCHKGTCTSCCLFGQWMKPSTPSAEKVRVRAHYTLYSRPPSSPAT